MASKPKRPTIRAQIESAKAPKGSVLEKLIRANQDFEFLHPEEFEDDYPVPLWLRVAYRKEHPELEFPSKNPGAAYPEVLTQIYQRMIADPNEPWDAKPPGSAPGAKT